MVEPALTRSRTLRRLRSTALWVAFAIAIVFAVVQWLVPWLGRRGNLNSLFERIVRSSLTVPVVIERIETQPWSNLKVTRLHSVSALAEERFRFGSGSIAIEYDPVEIFTGRVRNVTFERPKLFLNLDADLKSLTKVPDLSDAEKQELQRAKKASDASFSPLILPFQVDSTTIQQGTVHLRLGGRDLEVSSLNVELTNLGRALGQKFQTSFEGLGGSVRVWGSVDILVAEGQPARYAFHSANVVIGGVEASRVLEWLGSGTEPPAWLRAAALKARGKFQLEGTLDGTWPEKLELKLSTNVRDLAAAYGGDLAIDEGNVGLHLTVVSTGDAESLKFSLSTHGSGTLGAESAETRAEAVEDAFVEVEGELLRLEGDGGTLRIDPSKAGLANAGEVSFSGRVGSLLGDRPAELDLSFEAAALDVRAIASRIPPAQIGSVIPRSRVGELDGELRGKLHVAGTLASLRADGSFETARLAVPGPRGTLRADVIGSFKGVELDAESGEWKLEQGVLETGDIAANDVARALGIGGDARRAGGSLRFSMEVHDQRFARNAVSLHSRGKLAWKGGSLELERGAGGFDGLDGSIVIDAGFDAPSRKLAFEVDASASLKELLAGSFYADLGGGAIAIGGAGSVSWDSEWGLDTISIGSLELTSPVTGPIAGSASILRTSDRSERIIDASVRASAIPAGDAFRVFVIEPFFAPGSTLAGAKLDGGAALDVRIDGTLAHPGVWGRLSLARAGFDMEGLRVLGLEVDLPFELGTRSTARQDGSLHAREVVAGRESLGSLSFSLSLAGGIYSVEPADLRLYGGALSLSEVVIAPFGDRGLRASANLNARGLDVLRITRAHDLPAIAGDLSFDLEPILVEGNRVESHGTVTLRAFGGDAEFTDLTIDNVTRPYFDLLLREGSVHRIRLLDVGETFHFGIMSGVLEGSVKRLGFTGGELSSFEADLETVPAAGVSQYLNRGAIDSIRRVFAGPIGALEERFFSRFRYADFGFWCRLEDGVFRLRGKYRESDAEYIMRGRWYQFPRINIINGRPGRPYDWKTIVTNLRKIYRNP
jgi:hypothetical protein